MYALDSNGGWNIDYGNHQVWRDERDFFYDENWNPNLNAPLTQPGVNVVAGEYLLSVQGRDVRPPENFYSFFEETAGKSIVIRVGPDPNGANSREVTVVPVANENAHVGRVGRPLQSGRERPCPASKGDGADLPAPVLVRGIRYY